MAGGGGGGGGGGAEDDDDDDDGGGDCIATCGGCREWGTGGVCWEGSGGGRKGSEGREGGWLSVLGTA